MSIKNYKYSFLKVLGNYWFVFLLPIITGWALSTIDFREFSSHEMIYVIVGSLPLLLLLLTPLIAIFLLLKTNIILSETEIIQKGIFKEKRLEFNNILAIEKENKLTISLDKPKDLKIVSKDDEIIYIFRYLKNFVEIKKEIEKRTHINIGTPKVYKGSGSVAHKIAFVVSNVLLLIGLVIFLIPYYFDYDLKSEILKYALPMIVIVFYVLYVHRKSQIEIRLTENELVYEGANRKGLKFERFRSIIPWRLVYSVRMSNPKKGPVIIETSYGRYMYWNSSDTDVNRRFIDEINKKKAEK